MYWTKLKLVAAVCVVGVAAWGALVSAQVFEQAPPEAVPYVTVRPVETTAAATTRPAAQPSDDRLEALERKLDRLIQVLESGQRRTTPPADNAALVRTGVMPVYSTINTPTPAIANIAPPALPPRNDSAQDAVAVPPPAASLPTTPASTGTLEDRMAKLEQRLGLLEQRLHTLEQRAVSRIDSRNPYANNQPAVLSTPSVTPVPQPAVAPAAAPAPVPQPKPNDGQHVPPPTTQPPKP
jgi:hypothetical protein